MPALPGVQSLEAVEPEPRARDRATPVRSQNVKPSPVATSDTIPLPPLPENAPGRPSNLRYREQYGLILTVSDPAEQERVFNSLVKQGFKPRVVVT